MRRLQTEEECIASRDLRSAQATVRGRDQWTDLFIVFSHCTVPEDNKDEILQTLQPEDDEEVPYLGSAPSALFVGPIYRASISSVPIDCGDI